jgi:hypothetical protein
MPDTITRLQEELAQDLVKLETLGVEDTVVKRITQAYEEIYQALHEIKTGREHGCSRTDQ